MNKQCSPDRVGMMRNRVTIEQPVRTSDGMGGHTVAWEEYTRAWCSISPVKAWEKYQAMKMESPITHKIEMRYQRGITSAMRINFGGRIFGIKEVINENEEGFFLLITAIEKA